MSSNHFNRFDTRVGSGSGASRLNRRMGREVVGVDMSQGFVSVDAGEGHSLGLKADGSILAWGLNDYGQTDVPAPNADFIVVAAGYYHSLGLQTDGSIVAWGENDYGQIDVPEPNTGFMAIAAGDWHSLGIRVTEPPPPWVWGDYNGDRVIGLDDLAAFTERMEGPHPWPSVTCWHLFDLDADFDVDLLDFAQFQNRFPGHNE